MTTAPLASTRITAVLIRESTSSVVLLTHAESTEDARAALRSWLWGSPRIHRGRALGAKFRLVIDGVAIVGARLTAWMDRRSQGIALSLTADTPAARFPALGWRVGRELHEVELQRLDGAVDARQRVLPALRVETKRRVTLEETI
jgi:hypothetical protein